MADGLTKLTVWLTPAADAALGKGVTLTGDDPADVVNRALMLYAEVADIAANHAGDYWATYPDWDARGGVWLLVTRERPKKRWWRPW